MSNRQLPAASSGASRFAAPALMAAFIVLAVWGASHHAMWRDEMQAWLIARDSGTFADLIGNLSYEGHPPLWYLMLMPLARFGADPAAMHWIVIPCMAGAVALVLWRSPFSLPEKALFPFGYFILFEYAVKNRSYAVGCLALMTFCALWRERRRCPILPVLPLVVLAQVHVLFAIVAGAGLAALVTARVIEDGERGWPKRREIAALSLFAVGWFPAIVLPAIGAFVSSPPGTARSALERLVEIASLSALVAPQQSVITALAGTGALIAAGVLMRRKPAALALLGFATGGLIAVFVFIYGTSVWHRGILFLVFMAALWIAREPSDRIADVPFSANGLVVLGTVLLALQALAGLPALLRDGRVPISHARDVAGFIRGQGWAREPLIGLGDFAVSPVVAYLGAPKAYYADVGRWGSFVRWDRQRLERGSPQAVVANAAAIAAPHTLLAHPRFEPALLVAAGYREVARFTGASDAEENYVVYRRP